MKVKGAYLESKKEKVVDLQEISIQASVDELELLIDFIKYCIKLAKDGTEDSCGEHFFEFYNDKKLTKIFGDDWSNKIKQKYGIDDYAHHIKKYQWKYPDFVIHFLNKNKVKEEL